jgi:hypothetical protein
MSPSPGAQNPSLRIPKKHSTKSKHNNNKHKLETEPYNKKHGVHIWRSLDNKALAITVIFTVEREQKCIL